MEENKNLQTEELNEDELDEVSGGINLKYTKGQLSGGMTNLKCTKEYQASALGKATKKAASSTSGCRSC